MRSIFTFAIAVLILTACSQTPASATPVFTAPEATATLQPTNTLLPTTTPTPTATATPESKFPVGPLRDLEKSLGSEYTLVASEDGSYYTAKDTDGNVIPNIRFFEDGTAELAYKYNKKEYNLTIVFQSIAARDGGVEFGLWEYRDGVYNFETHPAPKTVAETQNWRKLVILRGHAKEQAMIDTVFAARDMSFESENYDPMSEFEGITVTYNFKTIDNFDVRPKDWEIVNWSRQFWHGRSTGNGNIVYRIRANHSNKEVVLQDGSSQAHARPMQVALGSGWYVVEIYDERMVTTPILHVPVIAMNSDRSLVYLSTLVRRDDLERISHLLNKNDRGEMFIWLFRSPIKDSWTVTDPKLMGFMTDVNREFFEKVRVPKLGDGVTTGDESWNLRPLPKELGHTFFTILASE